MSQGVCFGTIKDPSCIFFRKAACYPIVAATASQFTMSQTQGYTDVEGLHCDPYGGALVIGPVMFQLFTNVKGSSNLQVNALAVGCLEVTSAIPDGYAGLPFTW